MRQVRGLNRIKILNPYIILDYFYIFIKLKKDLKKIYIYIYMDNKKKCIVIVGDDGIKKYKIPADLKASYNNKYYNDKKEILLKKQKEKIFCKYCDKEYNKSSFLRHTKTQTHNLKLEIFKNKKNI